MATLSVLLLTLLIVILRAFRRALVSFLIGTGMVRLRFLRLRLCLSPIRMLLRMLLISLRVIRLPWLRVIFLLTRLGRSMLNPRRRLARKVRVSRNVVRLLLRPIVSGASIRMRRIILRTVLVRVVRASVICRLSISVKAIRRIILRLR